MENNTNFGKHSHNFGNGIKKLLNEFSSDVQRIMMSKKKSMEKMVKDSIEKTTERVSQTERMQAKEKEKTLEKFKTEFFSTIRQASSDLEKIKEVENKVQDLLVTMDNKKENERKAYLQRLQELKKLNDEFCKDFNIMDKNHSQQYDSMLSAIKKDAAVLQKKMLKEVQRKEMDNIRRHLDFVF